MPANERGSLKSAFANFNRPQEEREAELKLLGRTVDPEPVAAAATVQAPAPAPTQPPSSYPVATNLVTTVTAPLVPRPLLHREPVRQLSFRCPHSIASELRRKAAFNQLEQQQIIVEGIKRVLAELPDPPPGWQD